MAFYTICGKPDCPQFAHACYVAQYLFEHLPNFKYRKVEKSKRDWADFVAELNKRNRWYMVKSPIIWKEISTWGGKPYLIGGLGEFWEYCFCYYGLESHISKQDLAKLAQDNLTFFEDQVYKNAKDHRKYNAVISIFLNSSGLVLLAQLLEEFLKIPYLVIGDGFYVKLYEEDIDNVELEKDRKCLEDFEEYYNSLGIFGARSLLEIVKNEEDAIARCDLLIFMEDFSRNQEETDTIWMKRSLARIAMLADVININAKRALKVIFCNEGPICFMATCMMEYCTVLIPSNIVALTADRGLSVISIISEKTGVPVSKIGAPPVWGFVGFNEYIDESNIIFKAHILKPYKRALTAPENSTLPLGTVVPELRLMSYLLPNQHDEIIVAVAERKRNIENYLNRKPILSKLRALKSLLEIWYAPNPSNKVISLGVCSNGSYGIRPGIVFSQPCIQDQKQRWKPFQNMSFINDATFLKIQEFVEEAASLLKSIGFDMNSYCTSSGSQHTMQLDEDEILTYIMNSANPSSADLTRALDIQFQHENKE